MAEYLHLHTRLRLFLLEVQAILCLSFMWPCNLDLLTLKQIWELNMSANLDLCYSQIRIDTDRWMDEVQSIMVRVP